MFVTIVQLKHREVIANIVIIQNRIVFNVCVSRINRNDNGAATKLPIAQIRGSTFANFTLSL